MLLLKLDAVLNILILKQNAEELDQVIDEENKNGNYNDEKEAFRFLEVVKYFTDSGDSELIFTYKLRFVNGKRVDLLVGITLGLEDQIIAAVIDVLNTVRIKNSLAVDYRPEGNNVVFAEFCGIIDGRNAQ